MSGTLVNLIIQLISGAVGGNVAGAALKDYSLGTLGNSIAGIVGGGVGGWILSERYTRVVALRVAITAALIPMILAWAASLVTPDILVVCFLAYYTYFVSDPAMGRRSMLFAALFGALDPRRCGRSPNID